MDAARFGHAPADLAIGMGAILRRIEARDRLSDQLRNLVAELGGPDLIGRQHPTQVIHGEDHGGVKIVEGLIPLLTVLQCFSLGLELVHTAPQLLAILIDQPIVVAEAMGEGAEQVERDRM